MILSIILAVTSFVAQFVQQKQSPLFEVPQESVGVLTYHHPDYLRWEYTSPQPLVWELNGNKGNMSSQLKSIVKLIRESIKGDFEKAKSSFDVTEDGNTIILIPQKSELKNIFRSIRITLNPSTLIADKVEMSEAEGDVTIIYFTNVQFLEP
ncbi:MAG: outer membrane lipoprotein carrier protein LolA [Paludibacteraceae bacterium]|nr:outer membrane lipoprotein carrier protein LolA [Paludibacteraceae bacterium]